MGIYLRSLAGDFHVNNRGWGLLLRLAFENGWTPAGALPPIGWKATTPDGLPRSWNPADYFTGRGQRVRASDAAALADALESVLDDLPNHDTHAEDARRLDAPGFPVLYAEPEDHTPTPFQVFGGINKPKYRWLVAYARAGAFGIW
ncbi:MAG: hypothetical protein AAGK04_10960 [Planctomycetota bacterium]